MIIDISSICIIDFKAHNLHVIGYSGDSTDQWLDLEELNEHLYSLPDLAFVTPKGLRGGFNALRQAIEVIENNVLLKTSVPGEPQLGKRGLYPKLSTKESGKQIRTMMNLISYCDGRSLLEIAEIIDESVSDLLPILRPLLEIGLIDAIDPV